MHITKATTRERAEEASLPLPLELIEYGFEIWDKQRLNQGEVDEPLELKPLDQDRPEAIARIWTRMGLEVKWKLYKS